jgi:hypothetical protein
MASVPPADPVSQEPRKQRRTELDLGLSVALEEAINAKNKHILFRLGHIYYPRFKHVLSALGMPTYSELNLPGTMMEEYLKILQLSMLRQFVVNQEDWNIAFKLLGAAAFRLFHTEEMEIAASKGRLCLYIYIYIEAPVNTSCVVQGHHLPAIDQELGSYIQFNHSDVDTTHQTSALQVLDTSNL